MCRLGGKFAGILRADVEAAQEPALLAALSRLQAEGLTVVAHRDQRGQEPAGQRLAQFEIVGQDRPGIVKQISAALAANNVNVEELTTECGSAPMSGETLFQAQAKVLIPASCDLAKLRQELEKIAGDLMVEITFQELR